MQTRENELSVREIEIIRLVATGASNKEIAKSLVISVNTVKVHLRSIYSKIGVNSRTEAALYAVKFYFVDERQPLEVGTSISFQIQPDVGAEYISENGTRGLVVSNNKRWLEWTIFIVLIIGILTLIIAILNNRFNIFMISDDQSYNPTSWFKKEPMPTERFGLSTVVYESYIYAIGGETLNEISGVNERYDIKNDSWKTLKPKPTPVRDSGAVLIGGKIYLPGGLQSGDRVTDILEIYDLQGDDWSSGKSLPSPLSAFAIVEFEGKIILFGGWNGQEFVDTILAYDPLINTWNDISKMPSPRGYFGAVVLGSQIYLVGGYDGNQVLSDVDIFVPDLDRHGLNKWITGRNMPEGRYAMGVNSITNLVFVIGGIGENSSQVENLVLNTIEDEWQSIQQPILNIGAHLSLASLGTQLYLAGGMINDTPVDDLLIYQALYSNSFPLIMK